jgi:peptidoglycan glycosyltransferase
MITDYKDVHFSFEERRKAKRRRRIRLIGLAIIIILLYVLISMLIESGKIKKIQALMLAGKKDEAAERFKGIESSLFHRKTKKELKALIYLFADRLPEAQRILETMDGVPSSVKFRDFLNYFSDRARYRSLGIYTDYLCRKREKIEKGEELLYYRAMVKTALLDHKQSEEALGQLPPGFRETGEKAKALTLIDKINVQLKSGKLNYIFDINGVPLAYYDIKEKKTVSLAPGIGFDVFNEEFEESLKFYSLTLDQGFQETLHRLFRDFHGTFLLFNVSDSSIAAAYSKPINKKKKDANTVFSERYEPGSIMKLLTMFAYLKSSKQELFPFQCKGLWSIDGKIFYDWIVHNRVETCEEALAVSCNVAFAKMGTIVGFNSLTDTYQRFYFNCDDFADLFLTFKTGTTNKDISTDYRLANMSVGLNELSITTFHAALLSAVIAQNGSIYTPYLIKNKKNLLNIGFYNHDPQLLQVTRDSTILIKIKNAMEDAVVHPRGTGRRAMVDFVNAAIKTGTAGDKKKGLDAVITGFFPAEKPQYAFAFRLERGGKAEWRGALFLKAFLTAFYGSKSKNK